jgi:FAD dependent oxidoreductase TIGR03364
LPAAAALTLLISVLFQETVMQYDIAVIGAGIVGLAHALAATRIGLRVVVIEREDCAIGASVRNFGFITVTGQQDGECWRRAMRSRDVWLEVAPQAGVAIEQRGLVVAARRPQAADVLAAFYETEMGADCALLTAADTRRAYPYLNGQLSAGLYSPHECRVESRNAIALLATWLEQEKAVTFLRRTAVRHVETGRAETSNGPIRAARIVVCPGDDLATLYPDFFAANGVQRCKLQMLRLTPRSPFKLETALMTDLSLVRYLGYAELPAAEKLRRVLAREQPAHLAAGVHLIAVQSADGSLVVGDTHVYGHSPDPFSSTAFDALVLEEFGAALPDITYGVTERWVGTYASAEGRLAVTGAPAEGVRIVVVTSGTGASTAFAIAEETIRELCA